MADVSEIALLQAVRDHLRDNMGGWNNDEIRIEVSEEDIPPITGERYIMVVPAGVTAVSAPHESGGVRSHYVNVNVTAVVRAPKTPSDRTRELLVEFTGSLNAILMEADELIDFNYTVITAANTIITAQEGSSEGFIEPLRFGGMHPPQLVPSSAFEGATQERRAGLKRTIQYSGAKRLKTR